jgi:hypothetical protein
MLHAGRKKACNSAGLQLARLPGKAACNGAIAESMVKLVENAVF